jgi:hypothetical protein
MNKYFIMSLFAILFPVSVFAQQLEQINLDNNLNYACSFSGSFTFLLSIIIGAIATILVLRSSTKLRGGLFGLVLNYIGIGMFFLVMGSVSFIANNWFYNIWSDLVSMMLFSVGFIFIVLGANKLMKSVMQS